MDYNVAMQKKGFVFMIIMSVDLGKARTGIAICDKTEFLASPYTVIFEKSPAKLLEKVVQAAIDTKAERIVVGLPKNMDGSEGFRAEAVRAFVALLEKETNIPVALSDERLSTCEAHRYIQASGKKRKEVVDTLSAQIILQDYLDAERNRNR